jgi:hypothetical protein
MRHMADLNRLAAKIVEQATDETPSAPEKPQVKAGREGGQKGGKARAEKLSPQKRSENARKDARARWQS